MACLDTTILIDLIGRKNIAKKQATEIIDTIVSQGQSLFTTRFNLAELYVGIERSNNPEKEAFFVSKLLDFVDVLEFNETSARLFGQITAYLQIIGKPAWDMDVLIAATSLAYNQSLITRNSSHFENIPQLIVQEY